MRKIYIFINNIFLSLHWFFGQFQNVRYTMIFMIFFYILAQDKMNRVYFIAGIYFIKLTKYFVKILTIYLISLDPSRQTKSRIRHNMTKKLSFSFPLQSHFQGYHFCLILGYIPITHQLKSAFLIEWLSKRDFRSRYEIGCSST